MRFALLIIIFGVVAIGASQFVKVQYESNGIRADTLATRLVYTDAFWVNDVFDPSLFTQETVDERFMEETVADPFVARAGARLTYTGPDSSQVVLFVDEEAFLFHFGAWRSDGYGAYRTVELPVRLADGIGYYLVEVAAG